MYNAEALDRHIAEIDHRRDSAVKGTTPPPDFGGDYGQDLAVTGKIPARFQQTHRRDSAVPQPEVQHSRAVPGCDGKTDAPSVTLKMSETDECDTPPPNPEFDTRTSPEPDGVRQTQPRAYDATRDAEHAEDHHGQAVDHSDTASDVARAFAGPDGWRKQLRGLA